jgi:hypothetical protein
MEINVKRGTEYDEETACEIESLEQNHITLSTFHDHTILPRSSELCMGEECSGLTESPDYRGETS